MSPIKKQDAFDVHLTLSSKIEETYKNRNSDSKALQKTIDYCLVQIAISEDAKKSWIDECIELGSVPQLPVHRGYEKLCIIFEKQEQFEKAIELAKQAKKQGWNGDWDKRIERCEAKIKE